MTKKLNFNDGSCLDIQSLYQDAIIKPINLDDIIITFDKKYLNSVLGLDNDDKMQINSIDTLRRSLILYGQLSPIVVSIINNPDTDQPKYQLIDGLKRYHAMKTDHAKSINAIIINKKIRESKMIVRFLINERNYQSPEEIAMTGKLVKATTQDIHSSFIEKVYRLNIGDLNRLELAVEKINNSPKVKESTLTRYQNNDYTLKELIHRTFAVDSQLKNSQNGKTKSYPEHIVQPVRSMPDKSHVYDDPEKAKIRRQQEVDSKRSLSDMKVAKNAPTDLNQIHELPNKPKPTKDKTRSVADAEDLLRSKQSKQNLLDKQINSNIQNVGERKPLSPELRHQVLERDHYQCQICGAGGKDQPELVKTFEIHHLQDVQLYGPDELDNLILLCPSCHKLITDHKSFIDKPIPKNIPVYHPSKIELDSDPKYYGILVLANIENYAYKQIMKRLYNRDKKSYDAIRNHKQTIGRVLKDIRHKIIIDVKFNPYQMFVDGMIKTYKDKHDIGFQIPNPDILNQLN